MEFEEEWKKVREMSEWESIEELCEKFYQAGQADQREKDAITAENMQCEADGYHVCLHNESIAKAIRES